MGILTSAAQALLQPLIDLIAWVFDPQTLITAGMRVLVFFIDSVALLLPASLAQPAGQISSFLSGGTVQQCLRISLWVSSIFIPPSLLISEVSWCVVIWFTTRLIRVLMMVKSFFYPTGN